MYSSVCVNTFRSVTVRINIQKHFFFQKAKFQVLMHLFVTFIVTFTWTTLRQLQVNQLEATEIAIDPDFECPEAVWKTIAGGQRLSVTCFSFGALASSIDRIMCYRACLHFIATSTTVPSKLIKSSFDFRIMNWYHEWY